MPEGSAAAERRREARSSGAGSPTARSGGRRRSTPSPPTTGPPRRLRLVVAQPVRRPAAPRSRPRRGRGTTSTASCSPGSKRRAWRPAAEADRRTLIRRLSFDLIGLPPTPEEVDAFVADAAPDAYEKLVDRLLASPALRRALGPALAGRRPLRREPGLRAQPHPRERLARTATGSSTRSTATCPTTSSCGRRSPGTCSHPEDLDALIATGYHVCGTWDQVGHNGRLGGDAEGGPLGRARGPGRHPRAVVPRPLDPVRPLPRPQVRPDLAEGVLPGRRAARGA